MQFRPAVHLVDLGTCSHAGYLMPPGSFVHGDSVAPHALCRSEDGCTVVVSTYSVEQDGVGLFYGGKMPVAYHVLRRGNADAAMPPAWTQTHVVKVDEFYPPVWPQRYTYTFTMRLFQHGGATYVQAVVRAYAQDDFDQWLIWDLDTGRVWKRDQVPAEITTAASDAASTVDDFFKIRFDIATDIDMDPYVELMTVACTHKNLENQSR